MPAANPLRDAIANGRFCYMVELVASASMASFGGEGLTLQWPRWYAPSAQDRQCDAQTLSTLAEAGQISRETAVKSIADTYDIDDVAAELARIDSEKTE